MYGDQHLIAYKSNEEAKVIMGLSFRQVGWVLGGGYASMKLLSLLPPIPFIGVIGYLPHISPIIAAFAFAYIKHPKTGLTLSVHLYNYMKCKRRKRRFT